MKFKLIKSFVFALLILVIDVSKAMESGSFKTLIETHYAARKSSIDCLREVYEKEYKAKPEKFRNLIKHEIYSGHTTTLGELKSLSATAGNKLPASIILESFGGQKCESEVALVQMIQMLKRINTLDKLSDDKEKEEENFKKRAAEVGNSVTKDNATAVFTSLKQFTTSINVALGEFRKYMKDYFNKDDYARNLSVEMTAYTTATTSYRIEDYQKIIGVARGLSKLAHEAFNPLVDKFFMPCVSRYIEEFIKIYTCASEEKFAALANVETIYKDRWDGKGNEQLCFTLRRFFSNSDEYISYTSTYAPTAIELLKKLNLARSMFFILVPVKFITEGGKILDAYIASCYPATK